MPIHVSHTITGTLLMEVRPYPAAVTMYFNQTINTTSGMWYRIQVIAMTKM